MILLFFSLLLRLSSAEYLRDHLEFNVNISIHPCDNFYLHVCSQSIDKEDFPFEQIKQFYEHFSKKYVHISESANLPILNDIYDVLETTEENKVNFDHSTFRGLIGERCGNNDECYWDEFKYVYNYYNYSKLNDRLEYFANNLNRESKEKIIDVLIIMIGSIYDKTQFNETNIATEVHSFYEALMNRLFVMGDLRRIDIFGDVPNLDADVAALKKIIIYKFKNTPWMNERDDLGFSLLAEFEDKINDIVIHNDLDYNDWDLELLRKINSDFLQNYYTAKQRSTGVKVLDILLALFEADQSLYRIKDPEETMLVRRVNNSLGLNAEYYEDLNRINIFAPFMYPMLTDNITFDKPYDLFQTIGHEMFHSVILKTWANRSDSFKNEMECYNNHFNRTCEFFEEKSCSSGPQTFEEDGADVEGLRVAYDWFLQNHGEEELNETIFNRKSFTVNRDQAFFYLYGIFYCQAEGRHDDNDDEHSSNQVRVNGGMTQLPEFSRAFLCKPDQNMYTTKKESCHLFGPDSK